MKILCCSNDNLLIKNLIDLYGKDIVISSPNITQVKDSDLRNSEVMLVDLKDSKIPDGRRFPIPLIALTTIPVFKEAVILMKIGVKGYGNRKMRPENIKQAIESVISGQIWLPPEIVNQLISSVGVEDSKPKENNAILEGLSRREKEVAQYVTEGMSNQQMADKMFVTLRTVKAHLSSIYDKTGLKNRLELGLQLKRKAASERI